MKRAVVEVSVYSNELDGRVALSGGCIKTLASSSA